MEKIIVNPERVRCYGNIMMEHTVDDYTLVGSSILVDTDTVMGAETTVYTIEAEDTTISVALVSSVASCSIGDSIVLSATVLDDEEPVEGGTVTFKLGSSTLGTDETDSSGVATYTVTASASGSNNFTAVYESHSSNTVSVVVSKLSTSTALSLGSASIIVGSSTTASATVTSGGSGVSGLTVTFYDGSTSLGTGTTNGSGVATYTLSGLAVGSHSITAIVTATNTYETSTSSASTLTVLAHSYSIAFDSSSYTTSDGNVTAYVTLLDNSSPVSGASISLTGTGSTLSATTNSSGVATFNLTGISSDCTLTATYDNVSDTCTVTVSNVLFYDDATTDSSSRYTKADTRCSFTYDSNGYYVLSKTNNSGTSGIKINDTTFPKNVKITVDVYMTTNANTQPKLLFKNPSATYGYTPRLTYINNKASIIQGHYTGEGSSITGDVSYTQSLNTWYTFEFIHNDGALTFNIYKEGTLDKTLTATGSLSIADTGNEVGMCVAADSGKTYRFKNLKVEAL